MSSICVNFDGTASAESSRRFAEFVFWSIEAAESIKALSLRWQVPEETLRRYRAGLQSPAFNRLCCFRLNLQERLTLCRILGAGILQIDPLSVDERDRRRQNQLVGTAEQELRGTSIALGRAAQRVVEVIHEALADGRIDDLERRRVEEALDSLQAIAGRLRPDFFVRVRTHRGL